MVGSERFRSADCAFDSSISESRAELDGTFDVCIEDRIVKLVQAEMEVTRDVV